MAVSRRVPVRRKNSTGRLTVADERDMWELWNDGHSQYDIAAKYGITQARVSQICSRYGELISVEAADEIVGAFKEQLRQAGIALMPRVRRGDDTAIRTLVKVQERACRMLGLDKQTAREFAEAAVENQVTYVLVAEDEHGNVLDDDDPRNLISGLG